jgi:hypothetical protein
MGRECRHMDLPMWCHVVSLCDGALLWLPTTAQPASKSADRANFASLFCGCAAPLTKSPYLRLVAGPSPSQGRVEFLRYGKFGGLCANHWDSTAATVTCRQLGYRQGVALSRWKHGSSYSPAFSFYGCTGAEDNLLGCKGAAALSNQGWYYCPQDNDYDGLAVACSSPTGEAAVCASLLFLPYIVSSHLPCMRFRPLQHFVTAQGLQVHMPSARSKINCNFMYPKYNCLRADVAEPIPLRLFAGNSAQQGLVQVLLNNTWGLLSVELDNAGATVVCKQLGFSRGTVASFPLAGPAYLHYSALFTCTDTDADIRSCMTEVEMATYAPEVGVVCTVDEGKLAAALFLP